MRKSRRSPVAGSFAPEVEVMVSASDWSSRIVQPGSAGLLRQNREFSLPTSQGVGSNIVPVAITVAPLASLSSHLLTLSRMRISGQHCSFPATGSTGLRSYWTPKFVTRNYSGSPRLVATRVGGSR